jgi:hypothetical protein
MSSRRLLQSQRQLDVQNACLHGTQRLALNSVIHLDQTGTNIASRNGMTGITNRPEAVERSSATRVATTCRFPACPELGDDAAMVQHGDAIGEVVGLLSHSGTASSSMRMPWRKIGCSSAMRMWIGAA